MDACQLIERSIQKKYRKTLWTPFVAAVKRYCLIEAGDRIAVCVSGGRDSMLMAKLVQLLQRYTEVPFETVFLTADAGFDPEDRRLIEDNAALLRVPVQIFQTDADGAIRGALYRRARELCFNKIALGNHFGDVVEDAVAGMLYSARLRGMMPKARSGKYPGMALIRPMYGIHGEVIEAWRVYNGLNFPEDDAARASDPGRMAAGQLIRQLKRDNPDVEKSLFNSLHAVSIDTFPGWRIGGEAHSFLERYDDGQTPES